MFVSMKCGSSIAVLLAWTFAISNAAGLADDKQNTNPLDEKRSRTTAPDQKRLPFFGVLVDDVPASIASHFFKELSIGQGELIRHVYPGSPAAAAGLKVHDILLAYDDQKLFSGEQLSKLVHSDQIGREVSLKILRQGQSETVKIRLGEQPLTLAVVPLLPEAGTRRPFFRPDRRPADRPGFSDRQPAVAAKPSWHHLDSITIKWLEGERFNASLTHFTRDGKLEKHEYQGTREELAKLIDADADLRTNERHHLLRSLDIPDHPNPWQLFPDEQQNGF
jgi:hypothetical protein